MHAEYEVPSSVDSGDERINTLSKPPSHRDTIEGHVSICIFIWKTNCLGSPEVTREYLPCSSETESVSMAGGLDRVALHRN